MSRLFSISRRVFPDRRIENAPPVREEHPIPLSRRICALNRRLQVLSRVVSR